MTSSESSPAASLPQPPALGSEHWSQGLLRLLGGLFLLILALLAVVAFLVGAGLVEPAPLARGWPLAEEALRLAHPESRAARALVAIAALGVGVLAIGLLLLGPRRRSLQARRRLHLVSSDDRGFVVVDNAAVEAVAGQAAAMVRSVVEAEARVSRVGAGALRIVLEVQAYPGARIKELGEEIQRRVPERVEALLGLEVERMAVRVSLAAPDELGRLLE